MQYEGERLNWFSIWDHGTVGTLGAFMSHYENIYVFCLCVLEDKEDTYVSFHIASYKNCK